MTSLFEDLQEGLNQAIAYERGKGSAKVKTLIDSTGEEVYQCGDSIDS